MPPTPKKTDEARTLEERAAARGYQLEQDDDGNWYAAIGGTRWGPMATADEVEEFLPAG